jgi:hypothetical protein
VVEKMVYNPKEHAANDKNVGSKKATKEKAKPEVNKKTPKINKYGFLHVDRNLAKHLGIELGKDKSDVPVEIERIEGGFVVKIARA